MSKVVNRDVSNVLQFARRMFNFGRETIQPLRFENEWSKRSQPPANLPDGPSHKLAANYYYTRDARRLVKPPLVIKDGGALESGNPTKQISQK